MTTKFISLLTAVSAVGVAMLFAAEGPTKGEGTLMVQQKTFPLTHAVAYETTIDGEDVIAVVLSSQAISSEKIKEAKEADKALRTPDFKRPFLALEFKKTGKFRAWSASAGITMLGRTTRKTATGELTFQDGRVSGQASKPNDTEGMFPSGFDVRFDVPLLKMGDAMPATKKAGPAANVKPTVTGSFKGNGKEAKLAYVSAHWREPFNGKPSIVLVFTEKDHAKDEKPDFHAGFGKFGSALIISLHEDGSIFGCEVVHTALKKQSFSSLGSMEAKDFTFENGKVEAELTTNGPSTFFDETWEVDIKFVAPLGEMPNEFQPADSKRAGQENKPATTTGSEEEPATQPAHAQFKGKDLALTKDATDVEYQTTIGHVLFKSKSDVNSVAAELTAGLKAQGWIKDGSDMVNPATAILRRKHGEATLTIIAKPGSGMTQVTMFTEGLSWDKP